MLLRSISSGNSTANDQLIKKEGEDMMKNLAFAFYFHW